MDKIDICIRFEHKRGTKVENASDIFLLLFCCCIHRLIDGPWSFETFIATAASVYHYLLHLFSCYELLKGRVSYSSL